MATRVKLWVDDVRPAPDGWMLATNYDEAVAALSMLDVGELSLDHDLGMTVLESRESGLVVASEVEAKSGYDVATWLERRVMLGEMTPPDKIFCHSANPVGRRRIEMAIQKIQEARRD